MSCLVQVRGAPVIIRAMHRWLLLLLIALLPLRGWVAESMAGEMLQQHLALAAALPAGAAAGGAGHLAMSDCMDHPAPAASAGAFADTPQHDAHHAGAEAGDDPQAQGGTSSQPHGDCPTCASCQACSALALGTTVHMPTAVALAQPVPQARELPYFSVAPATVLKPPIS